MVFDDSATDKFFREKEELGIPKNTQNQLKTEGIAKVEDLQNLDADLMKELANNLRRPSRPGATPFPFSVMSQARMLEASHCVKHCIATGREVDPGHCKCTVIQNFAYQWKALEKQRSGDQPTPPAIGKDLNVPRWSEAFGEFALQKIRIRGAPLACVIRPNATLAGDPPELSEGQPHTDSGSAQADMVL